MTATALLLRGARLPEGQVRDVLIEDGRVSAVAPTGQLPSLCEEMDLSGFLLLPAPAEPHAHLDKALTWDLAGAPPCDLPGAVAAWSGYAEQVTEEDVLVRARRALDELVANGATAVRTHADVLPGPDPLRGLRALLRLREELSERVALQIAVLHVEAPDEVLDEALELGADLLGGCPHLSDDPQAAVARALTIAERHGVGVDLHADEHLRPDPKDLLLLAQAVRERGFAHGATASHCVGLGGLDPADAARIAKEAAASGIGVVALPLTNLYLQGRDTPARTPRGLTAVRALLDAGVPLAGGGDNIRDPFNPVGRADPLETAGLLVAAGHLTLPEAVHAVTTGARTVLGLPAAGPYEGAIADLLAVRADSLSGVVGASYPDRIVFKGGRAVSRTTVIREVL
ncbi:MULTISPECIES: amidohydrolase family protein [unclassified Streptomyces]|uniref:amidohydrolase family protein n=1 Tax=unclassified Streptomyces TaxID=2593676 RepID=UPI002E807B2F|nr:amidohydrolase family protein [Streptomyces sp. NBC_00589]WTI35703.1 amidohydrolase family protein [Streptomyces sp. NBC_00775]WUB30623.1 amidohydrolase family protein [Streptomyces sp. NBC_00589]